MKRFTLFVLVCLSAITGCMKPGMMDSEDEPRLTAIDIKLTNGEFETVLIEGKKYVKDYPRSFQGWGILGWANLKSDELEEAQACFDKCLEINPLWDNAYVGKGVIYRKLGDNVNARKSYLEAIRIVPQNAEAYASLLVIELLEHNDDQAVEYGEKAWALRKDEPSIPANLAVAYHYQGDFAQRDLYLEHAKRLGYYNIETLQDIFDGNESIR